MNEEMHPGRSEDGTDASGFSGQHDAYLGRIQRENFGKAVRPA